MALTMTQNGAFEISAQYTSAKKMKTTSEPLYLVSLGGLAGIPIA
jgi:hypothetical protein